MKPYIVTKPLTYATRHMVAGDSFEAPAKHGDLLVAIKKARHPTDDELQKLHNRSGLAAPPKSVIDKAREAAPPAKEPAATPAAPEIDERAALREQYAAALGKKPFPGWDADELRRRIAEHTRAPQS